MNEGLYCLVNIPTADTVLEGPRKLRVNEQDPSGEWHYNVNNPAKWPDTQLLTIGWYPYVLVDAGAPGTYYTRSLSGFQIQATEVVQTASYTQVDIEEVRSVKNDELERNRRQFTLQDKAINPHVEGYMRDDTEWMSGRQADLIKLTGWQEVADFDTNRPLVVTFDNNYIGRKYVDEGYKLTAQNQAATGSGQSALWDQAIVNSFVSANQLAANDTSGSQPPANPVYQIRRGVGKVNEQFARVVIFRTDREDPNPALRTTYKVRLFNKQDTRNLYVFSYFNSTFLAWHLIEDLGSNVWGFEALSSEWQWVPNDMHFIFSYGTNPAVEADFFTDRIDFDAGVESINVLIAWDPV